MGKRLSFYIAIDKMGRGRLCRPQNARRASRRPDQADPFFSCPLPLFPPRRGRRLALFLSFGAGSVVSIDNSFTVFSTHCNIEMFRVDKLLASLDWVDLGFPESLVPRVFLKVLYSKREC